MTVSAPRSTATTCPGAVVAIARRGQTPAITGYGVANTAARTPVDPELTAFRTASVSKVITAAVVTQLIDQGRLDPAADVNRYLDFTIPAYDGKPVTLATSFTHTAGFDDRYIGKSARSFELALPLGAYLKRDLPKRIVPPGEVFLYSNYGIALAGYIAERVCGKPFAELARDMVFRSLGMTHSSFLLAQPAATPTSGPAPPTVRFHGTTCRMRPPECRCLRVLIWRASSSGHWTTPHVRSSKSSSLTTPGSSGASAGFGKWASRADTRCWS